MPCVRIGGRPAVWQQMTYGTYGCEVADHNVTQLSEGFSLEQIPAKHIYRRAIQIKCHDQNNDDYLKEYRKLSGDCSFVCQ